MIRTFICRLAVAVLLVGCGSSPAKVPEPSGGWPSIVPDATQREPGQTPSRAPTTAVPIPSATARPAPPIIVPPWVEEGLVPIEEAHSLRGLLLTNGDVLLLSADGLTAAVRDAQSGRWRSVDGLPASRSSTGLIALHDGKALAVGGTNASGVSFSSIYRFDPKAGTWSRVGELNWARTNPAVGLLPDGRVLVAGGTYRNGLFALAPGAALVAYRAAREAEIELADVDAPMPVSSPFATVEIFDPWTGTTTMARPMACARGEPGVATLPDGRIMVTQDLSAECGAAEIYDPATGSWTRTGSLPPLDTEALAREGVPAWGGYEDRLRPPVALGDGSVMIAASAWSKHSEYVFRSFRFRPATNRWTQFGPTAAVVRVASGDSVSTKAWSMAGAGLIPLADGRLFVAGGSVPPSDAYDGWRANFTTTRIFDPSRDNWTTLAAMPATMDEPLGFRLTDGSVLLIGQLGDPYAGTPLTAIRYLFDRTD